MATAKKDAQSAFFDREVEDPVLEEAAETVLKTELTVSVRKYNKAKRTMKARVKANNLQDGERLRCGAYIIDGKERAGSAPQFDDWRVVVGKPRRVPSGE